MTNVDETIEETIKSYGYVNFQLVGQEEWSIYRLTDDGTIIKLKVVPLKFLKKDDSIIVNPLVMIVPFATSKGDPTLQLPTSLDDMMQRVENADMDIEVIQEPWNEYDLEGGIQYFMKATAVMISSTDLYDSAGEPIYLVNHQLQTKKHPMFEPLKKEKED